jgi:hypothetical protein
MNVEHPLKIKQIHNTQTIVFFLMPIIGEPLSIPDSNVYFKRVGEIEGEVFYELL